MSEGVISSRWEGGGEGSEGEGAQEERSGRERSAKLESAMNLGAAGPQQNVGSAVC